MRDSEEVKTAKSLNAEYIRLLKRANTPNLPKSEVNYTMNMVNRVKSRINFDLLNPKKKSETEDEYEQYQYKRR
jgi:hypothetical protein